MESKLLISLLALCAQLSLCTSQDHYQIINLDMNTTSSQISPKISVITIGTAWENITNEMGAPSNGIYSLHSEKGDDLSLSCIAPYPIQWNIRGILVPPEIVDMPNPKRNIVDNLFEIKIIMNFVSSKSSPDLVASAIIACEKIKNPEENDQLAIFVTGNTNHSLLAPLKSSLQSDPGTIPCPTSNPIKDKPVLYFRGPTTSLQLEVQDVTYNPTQGFYYPDSRSFPGGIYTCVTSTHVVMFNVSDLYTSNLEFGFAPQLDKVIKFSDEFMEFRCLSNTVPIKVVIDDGDQTEVTFVQNLEKYILVRISSKKTNAHPFLNGTVTCETVDGKVIKEWNWELVDPPKLLLDNNILKINCLSKLDPISLNFIPCKNKMTCDFMRESCFENVKVFNFETTENFSGDHLSGVVSCGVMGLRKYWNVFTSLENHKYADTNWKEVPHNELIKLDEIEGKDANDKLLNSTVYVCKVSKYLFADSIAFQYKFKNGSESVSQLEQSFKIFKVSDAVNKLYVAGYISYIDKSVIPEDATELSCLAPFWDSADILKATKYL